MPRIGPSVLPPYYLRGKAAWNGLGGRVATDKADGISTGHGVGRYGRGAGRRTTGDAGGDRERGGEKDSNHGSMLLSESSGCANARVHLSQEPDWSLCQSVTKDTAAPDPPPGVANRARGVERAGSRRGSARYGGRQAARRRRPDHRPAAAAILYC